MPSLIELFNSSVPLGQLGPSTGVPSVDRSASPSVAYDIQNAKLKPINIQNVVLQNTVQKPFNDVRSTFSDRLTETRLEQETSGLRVLGKLSEGLLYGTQSTRIVTRTTKTLDKIKSDKGGDAQGLIGGAIAGLRDAGSQLLGIPQNAVPTFVKEGLNATTLSKETQNRMIQLASIKKSAEGSIVGKFLKNNASGTPQQIASQALGAVAEGGKKLIRNILFGNPNTYYKVNPQKQGLVTGVVSNYGSDTAKINVINPPLYGALPPALTAAFSLGGIINPDKEYDAKGHTYSSTFDLKIVDASFSKLDSKIDEGGIVSKLAGGKISLPEVMPFYEALPGIPGGAVSVDLYTTNTKRRDKSKRGASHWQMDDNIFSDNVNRLAIYSDDDNKDKTGKSLGLDEQDFIPLIFYSPVRGYNAQFRATITGLSETFSPGWDSQKMIGNPFNFYTYTGVERSVTFNFKVYSLGPEEHQLAWQKLEFLTSLVYPQSYHPNTSYITPPIIFLTLGSMYKRKAGFFESLTYTIEDNTPWETGWNPADTKKNPYLRRNNDIDDTALKGPDIDMKNLQLPRIVDVAVTFKFIESRYMHERYKHYATSNRGMGIYKKPETQPDPSTSITIPSPTALRLAGGNPNLGITDNAFSGITLDPTLAGKFGTPTEKLFANGLLERNPYPGMPKLPTPNP